MEVQVNKTTELDTEIGLVSGFLGVISSPKVTFERLVKSPRTWVPSLILVIVSILFTLPFFAKYQEYNLLVAKKMLPLMPQGGMDINQVAKIGTISMIIGIMVSAFLMPLIGAALIKLLNFVMGEETEFKKIWTVSIYASIPLLLKTLLGNVLMLTANADHLIMTMIVGTSIASLVPPESVSGFVFVFLAKLDIFTIWSLTLTVIGVAQLFHSKISRVASVLFGVWIVLCLASAYMGQAQMSKLLGS